MCRRFNYWSPWHETPLNTGGVDHSSSMVIESSVSLGQPVARTSSEVNAGRIDRGQIGCSRWSVLMRGNAVEILVIVALETYRPRGIDAIVNESSSGSFHNGWRTDTRSSVEVSPSEVPESSPLQSTETSRREEKRPIL